MRDTRPGDLLFYKPTKRSFPLSHLISRLSHAVGEDNAKGKYSHVALVGTDGIYEMTWPRARFFKADIQDLVKKYKLECWRPIVPIAEKTIALLWAETHLGMRYDWGLLFLGLFDDKRREVCSTFVRNAYLAGGVDLYPGGYTEKITSPSELVRSPILKRIW